MYEYKKVIFLAALLSTGSPWILKSTHTKVLPQLTDDVTLRCQCENPKIVQLKLDQIMRIRLLKRNDAGDWMTFAEISVPNNSSVSFPHFFSSHIVASGFLGTTDESFLSVTWPTADEDTMGSYQCEVDGFGEDSRLDLHLSTHTVNITGFLPTTTDLVDIMIKIRHEIKSTVENNFLEVRYWPGGNFTLLSPVSGCPDTPYTNMIRGFAKFTSRTSDKPNNLLSSGSHLHADVFQRYDTTNILHLRFCVNTMPHGQSVLWPKGSYCIHYDRTNCPSGFKLGEIYVYLKSWSSISMTSKNMQATFGVGPEILWFNFCCRSDGDPKVPVLLPDNKPFYLYR